MKFVAPQQQRSHTKGRHKCPGPAVQHKAAMGRPFGLNHVAIGPAESGLEAEASNAARMAVHGQRNLGHVLTPTQSATVAIPSRGMPLSATQRAWLEPAFGADLAAVRIHNDADSATAARAEHAYAFTAGRDIYFGDGCYNPNAEAGRHLLAHEIAHVLQQTAHADAAHRLRATDTSGTGEVQRAAVKKERGDDAPKPDAILSHGKNWRRP